MFIKLKVHPGSKVGQVKKKAPDAYEIWVKASAQRGLANRAALETLARELRQEVRCLHIVKGAASPNKIVKIFSKTDPP